MSTKQIKQLLKKAFPDVKFSVTNEDLRSVGISYRQGPSKTEVRQIVEHFQFKRDEQNNILNRLEGVEQFDFVMIYRGE
jgi:hypothetical protein